MDFNIEKNVFLKALTSIQGIVERRTTMPILANVLLETKSGELSVTATDLEVGLSSSYPAQVAKKGKVTVSARNLYEIVKELSSEQVSLKKEEAELLEIRCGKAKFKLLGMNAEEFPGLPKFKEEQFVKTNGEVLDKMLEKAAVSMSTDEARYNLNGVFIGKGEGEKVNIVAADGHRLSLVQGAMEGLGKLKMEKGVIIPRKGLQELRKLISDETDEMEISFQAGNAIARKKGRTLVMRLIDGEFPDYKQVIPKEGENKNKLVAEREGLISVLKRMAIISQQKTRGVKFTLSKGKIFISSSDPDLGEAVEEIEANYNGRDIEVGFNARYLIDGLQVFSSKEVELTLNTELSPGVLVSKEEEGFKYILMPMRL